MITNIKKKQISLILLNARITKKSFKRWKLFSSSAKIIFQKFDISLSASLKSKTYLKLLGAKNIKYIGNLKFSQTEKNEHFLSDNLKKLFKSKKIWCSASTHNTEENLTALAHKKLKLKYKNLLTILIPRHINRTDIILQEMQKLNLKVHLHNSKKIPQKDTDIYLVNSYGKTKSFFKICKTVFLGGSMIKHGGQNPLEPARYGCAILHGPNVWNFEEIYGLLNKNKVSQKIINLNQLVNKINLIFKSKTNSQNIEYKIKSLGNKILDLTLKEINYYIRINEN
jgi:3-deoxy-D-manno-octulosonic-acid transferase